MDRKEKEPKALVEITVTWREPDATAEGEWRRQSCKRRSPRVLYAFVLLMSDYSAQIRVKLHGNILQILKLHN